MSDIEPTRQSGDFLPEKPRHESPPHPSSDGSDSGNIQKKPFKLEQSGNPPVKIIQGPNKSDDLLIYAGPPTGDNEYIGSMNAHLWQSSETSRQGFEEAMRTFGNRAEKSDNPFLDLSVVLNATNSATQREKMPDPDTVVATVRDGVLYILTAKEYDRDIAASDHEKMGMQIVREGKTYTLGDHIALEEIPELPGFKGARVNLRKGDEIVLAATFGRISPHEKARNQWEGGQKNKVLITVMEDNRKEDNDSLSERSIVMEREVAHNERLDQMTEEQKTLLLKWCSLMEQFPQVGRNLFMEDCERLDKLKYYVAGNSRDISHHIYDFIMHSLDPRYNSSGHETSDPYTLNLKSEWEEKFQRIQKIEEDLGRRKQELLERQRELQGKKGVLSFVQRWGNTIQLNGQNRKIQNFHEKNNIRQQLKEDVSSLQWEKIREWNQDEDRRVRNKTIGEVVMERQAQEGSAPQTIPPELLEIKVGEIYDLARRTGEKGTLYYLDFFSGNEDIREHRRVLKDILTSSKSNKISP